MSIYPWVTAALSDRIIHEQSASRLPSISAAWSRDGVICWQDAVGAVDARPGGEAATPETQYRIGSITKTFVGVLIMRLRAAGRLSLDDPLELYLPGTPIGGVTIGQLLSQSSGIRAETESPWWERTAGIDLTALTQQLARRQLAVDRFHYSNVGFAVLAAVSEALTGRTWAAQLRTDLLLPLGLPRTTLRPVAPRAFGLGVHPDGDLVHAEPEHDAGAMAPAGQLWSTTADLLRWATFLHHGSDTVLDSESLALMRRPRSWEDTPHQPWTRAYGLGLFVHNRDGQRSYGHGGSMPGFQAALWFREDGDTVAVLSNSTYGLAGHLADDLFDLIDQHAPARRPVWYADTEQNALLELTGEWFWGPARYVVRALRGGWLELTPAGAGRESRFRPTGTDRWEGQEGYFLGEPLLVVRVDGVPAYLDLASFRFTRTPYDPAADIPGGVDDLGWH